VRFVYDTGEVQVDAAAPSSEHWNVADGFECVNVNVADVRFVYDPLAGPEVIVGAAAGGAAEAVPTKPANTIVPTAVATTKPRMIRRINESDPKPAAAGPQKSTRTCGRLFPAFRIGSVKNPAHPPTG
jgi:hypothetical protein